MQGHAPRSEPQASVVHARPRAAQRAAGEGSARTPRAVCRCAARARSAVPRGFIRGTRRPKPHLAMARILIIDAAGDVAAAFEAGLSGEGYALERRASWDRADELAAAPDLVAIGVPGSSGDAARLTRALAARPELAGVPLLAAGPHEREGELL